MQCSVVACQIMSYFLQSSKGNITGCGNEQEDGTKQERGDRSA